MRVQPKAGIKVRDPIKKYHLPEGPSEVPESTYWLRRLRSGDVVIVPETVIPVVQTSDSSSEQTSEAKDE